MSYPEKNYDRQNSVEFRKVKPETSIQINFFEYARNFSQKECKDYPGKTF